MYQVNKLPFHLHMLCLPKELLHLYDHRCFRNTCDHIFGSSHPQMKAIDKKYIYYTIAILIDNLCSRFMDKPITNVYNSLTIRFFFEIGQYIFYSWNLVISSLTFNSYDMRWIDLHTFVTNCINIIIWFLKLNHVNTNWL